MKLKLVRCNYSENCHQVKCAHKELHLETDECVENMYCRYGLTTYHVIASCVQMPISLTPRQIHWLYQKMGFGNMAPFVADRSDTWIEGLEGIFDIVP